MAGGRTVPGTGSVVPPCPRAGHGITAALGPGKRPAARDSADKTHRHHAVIEQVHADLKNSALAHLPSGVFSANAAWLVLAVIAFNLTRAAGPSPHQTSPERPPRPCAAN